MRLSKSTQVNGNTYIVVRGEDGEDYCTILIPGKWSVEMRDMHSLNVKQEPTGVLS